MAIVGKAARRDGSNVSESEDANSQCFILSFLVSRACFGCSRVPVHAELTTRSVTRVTLERYHPIIGERIFIKGKNCKITYGAEQIQFRRYPDSTTAGLIGNEC